MIVCQAIHGVRRAASRVGVGLLAASSWMKPNFPYLHSIFNFVTALVTVNLYFTTKKN
jgi:hypothetical protein